MTYSIPKPNKEQETSNCLQLVSRQSKASNRHLTPGYYFLPSFIAILTALLSPDKEEITTYLFTTLFDMFILQTHFYQEPSADLPDKIKPPSISSYNIFLRATLKHYVFV